MFHRSHSTLKLSVKSRECKQPVLHGIIMLLLLKRSSIHPTPSPLAHMWVCGTRAYVIFNGNALMRQRNNVIKSWMHLTLVSSLTKVGEGALISHTQFGRITNLLRAIYLIRKFTCTNGAGWSGLLLLFLILRTYYLIGLHTVWWFQTSFVE
jgi:hypothetical protein